MIQGEGWITSFGNIFDIMSFFVENCYLRGWTILDEAPCTSLLYYNAKIRKIYGYSTAYSTEAAYLIGGLKDSDYSTTIAQFKNNQWSKIDDSKQGRRYHGSISVGNKTMVIGGYVADSS